MTFIVLPLACLSMLSVRWLIWLMMLLSPFDAAAVLVLGGRGVTPSYVPILLLLALLALHAALGARFGRIGRVLQFAMPLVLVLAYMLISAMALPIAFENQLNVWPEKADPDAAWPIPLAPNSSNLAQSVYALLDISVTGAIALVVSSWRTSTREIYSSFLFAALLVEFFALWQFASRVGGVPFPTLLLDSNPSIHILSDQSWGGMPRVNGTFSEPAALAFFLAGVIYSTAWVTVQGRGRKLVTFVLVFGCLIMAISTSTTGYVSLAVGGIGLATWVSLRAPRRVARRFWSIVLPVAALVLVVAALVPLFAPHILEVATRVASETQSKSSSQSFAARTQADLDSLGEVVKTYGLGVGWGSNRSSSLIPGLLSGVGVGGLALLIWFGFRIRAALRRARRWDLDPDDRVMLQGGAAALTGWIVAACLSGPTINGIPFFVLLGGVIGVLTRQSGASPAQFRRAALSMHAQRSRSLA